MNLQQAMSASAGAVEAGTSRARGAIDNTPMPAASNKQPLINQIDQAQSVSMDLLLKQSLQQLDALLRVTDVMAQQPKENSDGTP